MVRALPYAHALRRARPPPTTLSGAGREWLPGCSLLALYERSEQQRAPSATLASGRTMGNPAPMHHIVGQTTIELMRGDITAEDADAIVNAANSSLLGGGGVDGAIHRAAGPGLLAACRDAKRALPGGLLATGGAVMTPGFNLRAGHVIHCVGPIYVEAGAEAPRLLASCYREAVRLARAEHLRSIAFPSISTGVYGYPVHEAAPVALNAVINAVAGSEIRLARFVLFDASTLAAYEAALSAISSDG